MKKAFTVIELMIALIIFGSGLLVILVVLNKNILLSKQIELKSQATTLAKEGIEIVFNKRDSNNIKYQTWNYLTGNLTDGIDNDTYFESGKNYRVWTSFSGHKNYMEELSAIEYSKLYLKTGEFLNPANEIVYSGFYYNYYTGENTGFSRYANFTGAYLQPEGNSSNQDVMKLKSIVNYKWGGISGEIVLESLISNWK